MSHSKSIIEAVEHFARHAPCNLALAGPETSLTYSQLLAAIGQSLLMLKESGNVLALALDNGPAWAVADLSAAKLQLPVVPLPSFFSDEQVVHAIRDAGVDFIVTDNPERISRLLAKAGIDASETICNLAGHPLSRFVLKTPSAAVLPAGTAKVTYTSGTTGTPKGVCLSMAAIGQVAASLLQASGAVSSDRHVSLLPLSTLLENIGGLYVPLMAGATAILLPSAQVGLMGAAALDVQKMLTALSHTKATTAIMTPELLHALVRAIEAGLPMPQQLRFVAVGGASVSPRLLGRAEALGLPVYEGYGLSECSSVVAVNTPNHNHPGTVGKPLPHVTLQFSDDGEILVKGACLLGYAGDVASFEGSYWPTGDIGHLDKEGYLHVTGRKKNIFITSYGRNVAPEWVERELTLNPAITQAAVFGEGRPWNTAVIVQASHASAQHIDAAIAETNRSLPDYARIHRWIAADAPFTPMNGQLTVNARLRRNAIWQAYQERINALYEETQDVVL